MWDLLAKKLALAIDNINNNKIEKKDKSHSVEILKHSKNYSKLLDIYVDSLNKNITMKKWFKIIFFIVTMLSLISVVIMFIITLGYAFIKFSDLNNVTLEAILSIITIVVPSISSLIVAFIKLPEIIAQYLFNTKEDENMNLIIKNIQDYDKAMFELEQKLNELLMNNKDQNAEVVDDAIEEPPVEAIN